MKGKGIGIVVGKVLFSIALVIVTFVISASASSFQFNDSKDAGRLQKQLTRKITQVAGVWVSVKIASGVISILQEIQVEGSIPVVGGLAVAVEPLGWTEVIDNTLDHISNVCLWAMGALAVQKVLLAVSVWLSLKIIIPVCAVLILIAVWSKKNAGKLKRITVGMIIISSGICFAIPLSLELSNMVETSILSGQIEKTVNEINGETKEIEKNGNDVDNVDVLKQVFGGIAKFFSKIKNYFDSLIEKVVDYLILFIVTNILIPIGTLFGLKYFISAVLSFIGFSLKPQNNEQ